MGSSTEIFSNRDDVTRTRDNHLQERVVLSIEPIQLDYLCIQGNKASHQSRYFRRFSCVQFGSSFINMRSLERFILIALL